MNADGPSLSGAYDVWARLGRAATGGGGARATSWRSVPTKDVAARAQEVLEASAPALRTRPAAGIWAEIGETAPRLGWVSSSDCAACTQELALSAELTSKLANHVEDNDIDGEGM